MKRFPVILAASAVLSLAACGDSSNETPPTTTPFPRPTGYIAVGITVDDTANKVFANNEMGWKGAMKFAGETNRIVTEDTSWGGPFATLYDDGPWSAGGHEPTLCPTTANPSAACVAGDHKLGAIVFIKPPAAAGTNITIGYGMQDNVYHNLPSGDGWMWPSGPNGGFVVLAGQTTDILAQGMAIPAFGNTYMKVTLDVGALTPPTTGSWATNTVTIKGTFSGWSQVDLTPTAAGNVYTFDLGNQIGPGKPLVHTGPFPACAKPEWVFVLGGAEYKVSGAAATGGVLAYTRVNNTGAWLGAAVLNNPGNKNTYVEIPPASGTCP